MGTLRVKKKRAGPKPGKGKVSAPGRGEKIGVATAPLGALYSAGPFLNLSPSVQAKAARSINARAFTTGKRLLARESTHVVQRIGKTKTGSSKKKNPFSFSVHCVRDPKIYAWLEKHVNARHHNWWSEYEELWRQTEGIEAEKLVKSCCREVLKLRASQDILFLLKLHRSLAPRDIITHLKLSEIQEILFEVIEKESVGRIVAMYLFIKEHWDKETGELLRLLNRIVALNQARRWLSQTFFGQHEEAAGQYIDEHVTAVAINLVIGRLILKVDVQDQQISIPLSRLQQGRFDMLPVHMHWMNRKEAEAYVEGLRPFLAKGGKTPCGIYRGEGGLLWPTILNAQTAPRMMSVYKPALSAARENVIAVRNGFINILFWYIGARMPVKTKGGGTVRSTSTRAVGTRLIEGFSKTESAIIHEAQTILRSPKMATIRAAHEAGHGVTVKIGNRLIQYEPALNSSGLSMFGENGFLIGNQAFSSKAELTKTVLHELHRLYTSAATKGGAVSGALVKQETRSAFEFAEKAYKALFAGKP
jgi:hypothetical protein